MLASVATVAFEGVEARRVDVQVQQLGRDGEHVLHHRRPGRQGGGREPGAGARGLRRHRPGPAGQADHRQPGPRRPAQGGQPFRPAHRPGPAGLDGGHPAGRAGRLGGDGRAGAGRPDRPGRRDPAGRRGRRRHGAGPDLSRGQRARGGLGRRRRGAGPALADRPGQPFQGHARCCARPSRGPMRDGRPRARPARGQGSGERQAGAGDRRRRRPQPAVRRPARLGQVDDGGAPAGPAAAADAARNCWRPPWSGRWPG